MKHFSVGEIVFLNGAENFPILVQFEWEMGLKGEIDGISESKVPSKQQQQKTVID